MTIFESAPPRRFPALASAALSLSAGRRRPYYMVDPGVDGAIYCWLKSSARLALLRLESATKLDDNGRIPGRMNLS